MRIINGTDLSSAMNSLGQAIVSQPPSTIGNLETILIRTQLDVILNVQCDLLGLLQNSSWEGCFRMELNCAKRLGRGYRTLPLLRFYCQLPHLHTSLKLKIEAFFSI